MDYIDYYQTLGVKRDAAQADIKKAYRRLARKYHPDVSKETDAETHFKNIGEAYDVLKSPEKRAAYDQLGTEWRNGEQFNTPPDWNAGFEYSGPGPGDDHSAYSDFFESLFREQQRTHTSGKHDGVGSRGNDSHARILINLEDTYHGAETTLTLRHPQMDASGHVTFHERQLNISIPKGVCAGQHIRLKGQGEPGFNNQAGDLYLEIGFNPHSKFRISEKDVHLDLPITPWEAVLGASVVIPTPTGKVTMTIPPNSVEPKQMRLKDRGIPAKVPGHFYVDLKIVVPQPDSDEVRDAYKVLKRTSRSNPRQHLGV